MFACLFADRQARTMIMMRGSNFFSPWASCSFCLALCEEQSIRSSMNVFPEKKHSDWCMLKKPTRVDIVVYCWQARGYMQAKVNGKNEVGWRAGPASFHPVIECMCSCDWNIFSILVTILLQITFRLSTGAYFNRPAKFILQHETSGRHDWAKGTRTVHKWMYLTSSFAENPPPPRCSSCCAKKLNFEFCFCNLF